MTDETKNMSPDESPTGKRKTGVRKVNNVPLIIFGAVVVGSIIIMVLVMSDRAKERQEKVTSRTEVGGNSTMFANEVAGDRTAGMIEPLVVPVEDVAPVVESQPEPILIARPVNLDEPPVLERDSTLHASDPEAEQRRRDNEARILAAITAKTTVPLTMPKSAGRSGDSGGQPTRDEMLATMADARRQADAMSADDPTASYQAKLAQLRGGAGSADGGALLKTSSGTAAQFGANATGGDRWKLESSVKAPVTRYALRAGSVIPTILSRGINSELPGQITAVVSQDVYDSQRGDSVVIPKGTEVVGIYSSDVIFGQSRVLSAFQRLNFQDGKYMDLGAMAGADGAGYAGFSDQVDRHLLRTFGSALMMAGITAGIATSQNDSGSGDDGQSFSGEMSSAVGQQLGSVAAEMIRKTMNVSPVLRIRPGYRMNIVVTKDIPFTKPYQAFDY